MSTESAWPGWCTYWCKKLDRPAGPLDSLCLKLHSQVCPRVPFGWCVFTLVKTNLFLYSKKTFFCVHRCRLVYEVSMLVKKNIFCSQKKPFSVFPGVLWSVRRPWWSTKTFLFSQTNLFLMSTESAWPGWCTHWCQKLDRPAGPLDSLCLKLHSQLCVHGCRLADVCSRWSKKTFFVVEKNIFLCPQVPFGLWGVHVSQKTHFL